MVKGSKQKSESIRKMREASIRLGLRPPSQLGKKFKDRKRPISGSKRVPCSQVKKEIIAKKLHRPLGDKAYNWKGDDACYGTLHSWVSRWLGKPKKCEFCGKAGLTGRQIHWANIGHSYKRNLNDWLRLCVNCHKKYDKEFLNNG